MSSLRQFSIYILLIPLLLLAAMNGSEGAHAGQLSLTWTDNSNNEDSFKIERKLGQAGTFNQVATVGTNVISYTDSGLTDGTNYCYRLRAFNAAGDSAYSNEDCGSTSTITGAASELVFSTQPGNGTPGQGLAVQPVVEVRGAFGNTMTTNPDSGVTETVTIAFN